MTVGSPEDANKKIAAGICGILLGSLGIHKFILGYTTEGLVMLLVTVLTCGFGGFVNALSVSSMGRNPWPRLWSDSIV